MRLENFDTSATHGYDKADARARPRREQLVRLGDLQDRFWAEAKRSVLVVLQGIDAAGKDGTINKVMEAFNPQGCPVTSFKVPSAEELAHDYLWRVHKAVPRKGEIGIFNRSHYEDVLVVRVHDLVPKAVWSKRYDQINAFEQHLADNGTTIVKFFLSISKDEQRERFQARYDDPTKRWKFSLGDLEERKRWDDYQRGLRRRPLEDVHGLGAVVRDPGRPQVVPRRRRVDDPRRHPRRPRARPTRRRPTCRPTSSSSSAAPALAGLAAAEQGPEDPADDVLPEPRADDLAARSGWRCRWSSAVPCAAAAAAFCWARCLPLGLAAPAACAASSSLLLAGDLALLLGRRHRSSSRPRWSGRRRPAPRRPRPPPAAPPRSGAVIRS